MIHELLLSPTETASGSHPCCVVSVTYHRPSYFHGDCLPGSRGNQFSDRVRCVLFVSFTIRWRSMSPTFSTFLEAVHAGLLIVKLLWRLQLITLQPNREP